MTTAIWMAATLLMLLAAVQIGGADDGGGPVANDIITPAWDLDYIGIAEQAGSTYYDYQHNGSMTRMVAYGTDGTVHCAWMMSPTAAATPRYTYYNKRNAVGVWAYGTTGTQVNVIPRTGYVTMDLDPADNAVIFYHGHTGGTAPNNIYVWNSTGEHACPVAPGTEFQMTWPHGCVDSRGYYHIVAQATTSASAVTGNLYYTRSQDGGVNWTAWQLVNALGTAASVSQTACASAGGKVALAWTKPINNVNTQADIYYVESTDGVTWNFAAPVNMTNFAGGAHPDAANSRAWDDVNLLYDAAENLHAVYTTIGYPTATNGGKIWHWSLAASHSYITGTYVANPWTALNAPGAWRKCIDRPSLAYHAGILKCQWGQCTTPGDVSAAGYGNWDVWATYSTNNGVTWKAPVNITDTATPGAPAGLCLSENWANMAKVATDKLHIQYIKDLDAGGIPQTEGTWTNNPVIYHSVPEDSILTYITVGLQTTLPIVIPPTGGSFTYTVTVRNTGYRVLHFDAWIDMTLPNGNLNPVLNRLLLTLPPGGSIVRTLTQNIPGSAPAGNYLYWAHAGTFPWIQPSVGKNIWAENSFPFSKSGVGLGGPTGWECTGWDDPQADQPSDIIAPQTQLLAGNYPNPFNPLTTINYVLPQTSLVKVSVYNVAGAEVAQLVNGWRQAGSHQVAFDATNLSSGVYVYQVRAGEMAVTGKMLLVK